ncbi:hypothetical protein CH063_07164 [Colletotrichum higginsianum]|uniref:Uncharacterized protein n=1 Tax=Colletotrichum higginsianum (strain IMI 349063) TaxID=759273 RepID=H1V560_COLHI|nr:hypothetical protein CH063_07164 [Colletotrichum higginsianum]
MLELMKPYIYDVAVQAAERGEVWNSSKGPLHPAAGVSDGGLAVQVFDRDEALESRFSPRKG